MNRKICFVGGARYGRPLEVTLAKKFSELKSLGELFVIGYSQDVRPRRFTEHGHFYLLPKLSLPVARYAEMFIAGAILILWIILRHRVQILVAQSPYEGYAAAWAKKIAGWFGYKVVLVVESHGDFAESLFLQRRIPLPGLYRFLMGHAAHFALTHADSVRVVSSATRRQIERWMPGKPLIQFPAWTDIDVFLQAGLKRKHNSQQEILYTGVLIPRKGVHHLVNAFARVAGDFPQARLILLGQEEDDRYAAELKKQVRALGLDRSALFVPAMAQAELAARMQRACVFVLPSISEGLGRVVVEAMATGTPVIGSDVGGIPDMVKDGETGFLVGPGDERAVAEKIRWVLEHGDHARDMGTRARAFAESFFSTRAYIDGYRQIFAAAQTYLTEDGEHAPSTL